MSDLKITLIQSNLYWENIDKNLEMFSKKIDSIKESTHLIILPEMFTTGFTMKPEILAESMYGKTLEWMKKAAQNKKCVITGSFVCLEKKKYYNRLVWMTPSGSYQIYDKRHLFSYGAEHKYYSSGNSKLIAKINDWKICPLICYDLRFPVWSRNKANKQDYDVLIYVANWPKTRSHAWKTLLQARAIENQSYVIGVNRIGKDGNNVEHSGDSAVINYKGEIISFTKTNKENIETIILKKSTMNAFRKEFPALQDADNFAFL